MEIDDSKKFVREDDTFNKNKGPRWPNLQERDFYFRIARIGAVGFVGIGLAFVARPILVKIIEKNHRENAPTLTLNDLQSRIEQQGLSLTVTNARGQSESPRYFVTSGFASYVSPDSNGSPSSSWHIFSLSDGSRPGTSSLFRVYFRYRIAPAPTPTAGSVQNSEQVQSLTSSTLLSSESKMSPVHMLFTFSSDTNSMGAPRIGATSVVFTAFEAFPAEVENKQMQEPQ